MRDPQHVRIDLYDARGRHVRTLYDDRPAAESMTAVRVDGSGLASGIYFVHLAGEKFVATEKVVLVR